MIVRYPQFVAVLSVILLAGCAVPYLPPGQLPNPINPAKAFSEATHQGRVEQFSVYNVNNPQHAQQQAQFLRVDGNPDLLKQGWHYQGSVAAPKSVDEKATVEHVEPLPEIASPPPAQRPRILPPPPGPPPGSSSPYYRGQMTANPSLWPGSGQGPSLFRDFRAFSPMDLVTVMIEENSEGTKDADTETSTEFDLLAGITEFFGVETAEWAANNTSLDPTQLIVANTDNEFKGEADTTRKGTLTGTISAVIMEILPNGLLRLEGTKIISVNNEEEVMVISGLVRQRDINSQNRVSSSRIANMRIDFYGRGIIAEQQSPGWGARIFSHIWPF